MKVLNARDVGRFVAGAVYVGRKDSAQHYGNPFTHKSGTLACVRVSSRQAAIEAFEAWLAGTAYQEVEPERRAWILANLGILKGKDLICWCAPEGCHASILIKLAN